MTEPTKRFLVPSFHWDEIFIVRATSKRGSSSLHGSETCSTFPLSPATLRSAGARVVVKAVL
jgi:hypothetical protein